MSLAFLTLGLICAQPSRAQSGYPGGGYPGGGSGYPGGGSGGGVPDPGHRWSEAYSSSGANAFAISNTPAAGESTPLSFPWDATNNTEKGWGTGGGNLINANVTGEVTVTLTWIPASGKTLQSDPPAKTVSIVEAGFASEYPGMWGGAGTAPVGVGSASNGLGDAQVPNGLGYTCSGSHRVKKDGSSGTITLGPFTLAAVCPVSTWNQIPIGSGDNSYEYYYWDWMGGMGEVGISVEVMPPAYPVNFRCTSADAQYNGELKYVYAWDSSTDNLADLDGCTLKERISYENNVGGVHGKYENTGQTFYIPPLPFAGVFADPEIYGNTPGTDGFLTDTHYVPLIPGSATIPGLYQYGAYNAAQEYIYTDDNSDPNNPNDYTVLRGPIDIDREVYAPGINWIYRITKYDAPEGSSKPYAEATVILGPIYPQFGP